MNRLKYLLPLLLILFAMTTHAGDLRVDRLDVRTTDLTARTQPVKDLNGEVCALVKVMLPVANCTFEGSVMGTPQLHVNTWWVYMPGGSRQLIVNVPGCKTLTIDLTQISPSGLESATTYVLELSGFETAGTVATENVTFKVTPANAVLIVDNAECSLPGGLGVLALSCDEHSYMVYAPGYEVQSNKFIVSKGARNKIIIELDPKPSAAPIASQTPASAEPAPNPTPTTETPSPTTFSPEVETFTVKGVNFEMVKVDGGTFQMGSNDGDDDEKPVHSETVGTFYIGKTEVTQALWEAVMGENPSCFRGSHNPVEQVSWNQCLEFIRKLNALTGKSFRLPTEAEWEYAARGGNKSRGYKYSGSNNISDVACYAVNSGRTTHPVGTKQANELGLYDMSGNVWEWCADKWCSNYSSPRNSSFLVYRGGSWSNYASDCRVAFRYVGTPRYSDGILGFRLAL